MICMIYYYLFKKYKYTILIEPTEPPKLIITNFGGSVIGTENLGIRHLRKNVEIFISKYESEKV